MTINRVEQRRGPARARKTGIDTRTTSIGAVGNVSFELGGYSYRVVLNCRSEDGAAHTTTNDSTLESQHTPR